MKTRTATDLNAPLSQERYMSSPEYNHLRGVSAMAAATRAAIIPSAEKRKLIWFLQGKSIAGGGLRKVAEELISMYPERLNEDAIQLALHGDNSRNLSGIRHGELSVEEFLVDLCINPLLQIRFSHEDGSEKAERNLVRFNYREVSDREIKPASLRYFENIIGTLSEYKRRHEKSVKEGFILTAIGRKIWETLDFALSTGTMVLLDGLEGRGKTEAIKAWCELHLGEARFVSLKGINNKTTAFREIAKALGIAGGNGYKSTEMQARIEDVLQRSKLMLVVDEAHFIFNQRQRIYTRPELADWIHSAICNHRIPLALVSTPQFMICMTRAATQVDWNYRQFRRRVRRYVKLAPKNTPADIECVIRKVLPGAPNSAVKQVLAYVHITRRDLSAVGDVVDEIKALQGCQTLTKVTYEEVTQVIDEHLVPSEKNFMEAICDAETKASPRGSKRARPAAIDLDLDSNPDEGNEAARQDSPARPESSNRIASALEGSAPRFGDKLITA